MEYELPLAVLYDPAWPGNAVLPEALAVNDLGILLGSARKKWL